MLGISIPTLYSYVSRGLVRSEAVSGDKRARRYRAEDIQALKLRQEQRRNPARLVTEALNWGEPVMESAITLLADNQLYYRGYNAVDLATHHTVEQVAALIWLETLPDDPSPLFEQPIPTHPMRDSLRHLPVIEAFQVMLPAVSLDDLAAYDLRPESVAHTGARILHLLTTLAADVSDIDTTIAHTLQQSWIPHCVAARHLINAALILCADHELNVSSFTARCAASAGATPYQAVIAGLAALQGTKHGRATERIEAFLREAHTPAYVHPTIASYLKRGEAIPGFGHPLYPQGDPRGRTLVQWITNTFPTAPDVTLAEAIITETYTAINTYPTLDFGLVLLARVLQLPPGSPLTLFALGRTIGWIGHTIEQYQRDQIIRPRAQYTGSLPR